MMGALTQAAAALRAELERAVLAEVTRVGPDAFNRASVIKPFLARGAKQSTLYRWVDAILASGRPDEHARQAVAQAAAERAARTPDPAADVGREVATKLPTVMKIEQVATAGVTPVIDHLNVCLEAADQLMRHARTEEGKVRNSRLLLQSSEHLRRCIDTAARITDTLMRGDKIERYHAAIIEEIARESPVVAERILHRIARLNSTFGNA